MPNNYKSILSQSIAEFKEKNSKFIAYAFPFNKLELLKFHISELKKNHPKASHYCYAYRIGYDKNNFRVNDDGEPSGTAGKPILSQIDSFEITNVLIIVIRYFGGIQLGASGLTSAYKRAAKECLSIAKIEEFEISARLIINVSYEYFPKVIEELKKHKAIIIDKKIGNETEILIELGISKLDTLKNLINNYSTFKQI